MKRKNNWKEFRYLHRTDVKNYLMPLDRFIQESNFLGDNIKHFIDTAVCNDMRCSDFDFVYTYLKVGMAIDIAWLIFQYAKLKKSSKKSLLKNHNSTIYCSCNNNTGIFPPAFLSDFFKFRSHREWYTVLDDFLLGFSKKRLKMSSVYDSDILIPIRNYLCDLPIALETIHTAGGIHVCLSHEDS